MFGSTTGNVNATLAQPSMNISVSHQIGLIVLSRVSMLRSLNQIRRNALPRASTAPINK